MKKKLIFLCLIIFILYILAAPAAAVNAAADGLLLWYERVLPTLLPFAILSNILIYSNYLRYLTKPLAKVTRLFLPTSDAGAFVFLSGFLFGFPMGSKNCAELLKQDAISREEAMVLFVITNNISPVFISGYIFVQELKLPSLTLISLVILYLPPLLHGACRLSRYSKNAGHGAPMYALPEKKPASGSQMNFKIIDAGIMNGFETLTRLGGYIMMFSIIASMLDFLPLSPVMKAILTGITEITNGIHRLTESPLSEHTRYLCAMTFTAFGGLSGIAQTSSMVEGTGLPMGYYVRTKLLLSFCSLLGAMLAAHLFGFAHT